MSETKQEKTIDIKQAAERAAQYFREITGYQGNISIEETEESNDLLYWLVTLGYMEQNTPSVYFMSAERTAYKIFKIAKTGEVVSMKIREFKKKDETS